MPSCSQAVRNLTGLRSASLTSRNPGWYCNGRELRDLFRSIRPLRVNTVNLCRTDLSILKVIGCRRLFGLSSSKSRRKWECKSGAICNLLKIGLKRRRAMPRFRPSAELSGVDAGELKNPALFTDPYRMPSRRFYGSRLLLLGYRRKFWARCSFLF
jgi:hypothetical protein